MFTVYHSNKIDTLKIILAHYLREDPLTDPFQKELILVQSPGMSQWLTIALAQEIGIAANLEFPLPASFIWRLFSQTLPDVPQRSAFNKESLVWSLMVILPSLLDNPEFAMLKEYLKADKAQLKLYQLALKIADIFDGYLVYRPDWILSWEKGQLVPELAGEDAWQAALWLAIYQHKAKQSSGQYHRANLHQDFIHALRAADFPKHILPKRLFIFGITAFPPQYLDLFAELGQHTDVYLMLANPCQYYWGDLKDEVYLARLERKRWIKEQERPLFKTLDHSLIQPKELNPDHWHVQQAQGNSLLASMGKPAQEMQLLLSQTQAQESSVFIDIERHSLLRHLQADILHLTERPLPADQTPKRQIEAQDRSLSVHLCHSPMRELEVLHDHLLMMFEQDEQLMPRDIIVMVADINAYAPYIQAVFGNASRETYLPYAISDRNLTQESPLLTTFLQLLALPKSRYTASELVSWLEVPEVMARFELSLPELALAKEWITQTGVRWGLDEATAVEFGLPAMELNTWQFGIHRLLLGYAMPEAIGHLSLAQTDIAPYDAVQGLDAELAGKLAHYVESLVQLRAQLQTAKTISQWQTSLLALLERFFLAEGQSELALASIREVIGQCYEQLQETNPELELSLSVIEAHLNRLLGQTQASQRFLAGQINFCTLTPMRSIPFKHVCLLGMNEASYPRNAPVDGFDLMRGRSRVGDRSRRDDDRYLFLEALLAAQESLYISYVAYSIQDNSTLLPSVLVNELLEYCQHNYTLMEEEADENTRQALLAWLCRRHSMTPFNPNNFIEPQKSYAKSWFTVAWQQVNASSSTVSSDPQQPLSPCLLEVVELKELLDFWSLPVAFLFKRKLNLYFNDHQALTVNDEPFALDNLENYQQKQQLLTHLLTHSEQPNFHLERECERFYQQQRAEGKLPIAALGVLSLSLNQAEVLPIYHKVKLLSAAVVDNIELELVITLPEVEQQITLLGHIEGCYQDYLLRYRVGNVRAKDVLSAWIEHLCLAAIGKPRITHIIGNNTHYQLGLVTDAQQATSELATLLSYFQQGQQQALPFFPELGWKIFPKITEKQAALSKMQGEFEGDGWNNKGIVSNAYVARVWPNWQSLPQDELYEITQQVLLPIYHYLNEVK